MGLFGLLATMLTGGALLGDSIKDMSYASEQRQKAIRNGKLTYGDGKGHDYLTSTGERVYSYGGQIRTVKDNRLILDYEQERYKKDNEFEMERAKKFGYKFVRLYYPEFDNKRYYVELSTMKRYYLMRVDSVKGDTYYKIYYKQNKATVTSVLSNEEREEKIKITKEEYEELAGYEKDENSVGYYLF